MYKKYIPILILILIVLLTGCAEQKNPLPSKAHTDAWMNSSSADFHGTKVLSTGYESCKSCHGEDLMGGESGTSCQSCHESYPHQKEWFDPRDEGFHGKYLKEKQWVLNDCASCHGDDFKGGKVESSCLKCHKDYPHSPGWMTMKSDEFHSVKVLAMGYESCKSCHGDDLNGGKSQVACARCHANYPHPKGWLTSGDNNFHGTLVVEMGYKSCQNCHDEDFSGGQSKVACASCHADYPHTATWMQEGNNEFHGTKALTDGIESCASCHGDDYMGGTSKSSCYTCHDNYPHQTSWATAGDANFHGASVVANGYESCKSCHGDDLQGGSSLSSCFTCHENYPHSSAWSTEGNDDFHGTLVLSNGYESCKSCHGDDLMGGNSNSSCYTCHTNYPHQDSWMQKDDANSHGAFVFANGYESCASCHGEDYTGGSSKTSCYTCHETFPHKATWMTEGDSNFHGTIVFADGLESCASCHGDDYTGGKSNSSCYKCHTTYPHKTGWTTDGNDNFHGQSIMADNWSMDNCTSCHGDDYKGGKSNSSCYTCHSEGPTGCNVCHGSAANNAPPEDLSGNTATTAMGVGAHQLHFAVVNNCTTCHAAVENFDDPNHIDDTPNAEVNDNWGWDRTTGTCASSCHPNETYIWNDFN